MTMHDQSPPEMAHTILTRCGGDRRLAEVAGWEEMAQYPKDSAPERYWLETIRAIVFGSEYPPVARVRPAHHDYAPVK